MLNSNSTMQLYIIAIVFVGAIFVNPISGLSENSYLDPLVINSSSGKANPAQDNANPIQEQVNSVPGQVKPIEEQTNYNPEEVKLIEEQAISKPEDKQIEEQAIYKPDQVNSELKDFFSMSVDDQIRAFDLSKDVFVNNQAQATLFKDDAVYLFLTKDSIDKQENLESENENPFLQEDVSVDITNLNYEDYIYFMGNKENSIEGDYPNKNGQGIDDMFYVKPLGLYPNTQRLSKESLNDLFDDKVINNANVVILGQNRQPVSDFEKIQIIKFFDETRDTYEQNQGLPNIDYNFEFPNHDIEKQLSTTKSRISLFVFGWMFMITGIALSCFIIIVGRKAANNRNTKKFTATEEQPYHALRSEV